MGRLYPRIDSGATGVVFWGRHQCALLAPLWSFSAGHTPSDLMRAGEQVSGIPVTWSQVAGCLQRG